MAGGQTNMAVDNVDEQGSWDTDGPTAKEGMAWTLKLGERSLYINMMSRGRFG